MLKGDGGAFRLVRLRPVRAAVVAMIKSFRTVAPSYSPDHDEPSRCWNKTSHGGTLRLVCRAGTMNRYACQSRSHVPCRTGTRLRLVPVGTERAMCRYRYVVGTDLPAWYVIP